MSVPRHVIDTNVLLVASAAHDGSPFDAEATPVQDRAHRRKVLDWLESFEASNSHIVLDWEWVIVDEYKGIHRRAKLTEEDYGLLVVLQKFSTQQYFGFQLEWDEPESATISEPTLSALVTDHADRKMVSAVIAAGGHAGGCNLVNACDTDWYDWQEQLEVAGIYVHQVIGPEWCHPKWLAKKER